MKLHGNARTCPHSRRLIAVRVLEQGWTLAQAAEAAGASVRTARSGLPATGQRERRVSLDRSSEPLSVAESHPGGAGRGDRVAAPVADDGGGDRGVLGMPLSTVSAVLTRIGLGKLSRLSRSSPRTATRSKLPGELVHIDVKKLVRIERAGHRVTGNRRGSRKGHRLGVRPRLCRRRNQARLRRGARRREGRHRGRLLAPGRRALRRPRHPGAETDDRQRARLHLDRPPARLHHARDQTHSAPGPTGPAPTGRPNASSAPCSAAGPTAPSTAAHRNEQPPCPAGSTTTIAADHTAASATNHP